MKTKILFKRYFLLIVILYISFSYSCAQNIKLNRTDKPDKFKTLYDTDYLEINTIGMNDSENSDLTIFKTYNGYLNKSTGESISIKYDFSVVDKINLETGCEKIDSKEIYGGGELDEQEVKIIDIDYIIHHKKSEKIFNIIGSSALIGVVISPIFGMYFDDNKNLQMNSDTYIMSVGSFAVIAGFSFSASKLFGRKEYYINPDYEGDKNVWKISIK